MRSRRSVIRARLAGLSDRRSARLSFGPDSALRRARAADAVMGAGTTGPLVRLVAVLRLGVGRPLGSVLRDPRGASVPEVASTMGLSSGVATPFLRPSSFTVVRLLREAASGENARISQVL